MAYIRALCVLLGFLALGEAAVRLAGIPFPGSIVGMFLLFAALHAKWVQAASLKPLVDVLMDNLTLFLVPPCVAVMQHLDLIARDWKALLPATVLSTLAVMFVTGKSHEWLRRRQ